MNIEPVAIFHGPMKEKFGIPRQAGLAPALGGEVRFAPPYDAAEAVRGLDGFDYCWLIWGFSKAAGGRSGLTVRPPRLGGNERMGVFATRSPFRPNGLGLSCVKLESVEPGVLHVSGADLLDGTPIYDVKPYVAYADSREGARSGFVDAVCWDALEVEMPDECAALLSASERQALAEVLSLDPRPAYKEDGENVYGMVFGAFNVKFSVDGRKLLVHSVEKY